MFFFILNEEATTNCLRIARLFVLLRAESSVGVGQTDRQLLGALDNVLALLGGHAVGDLSAVDAVLHEQHLQLLDVVDEELLEAGRQHMTGARVRTVTDVGHQVLALEATTHSVVNTLGLAPVGLHTEETKEINGGKQWVPQIN